MSTVLAQLKAIGLNVWAGAQTAVGFVAVYFVAKHFGLI